MLLFRKCYCTLIVGLQAIGQIHNINIRIIIIIASLVYIYRVNYFSMINALPASMPPQGVQNFNFFGGV